MVALKLLGNLNTLFYIDYMDMYSVKYNNIIVNWELGTFKPFTSNVGPNFNKKKKDNAENNIPGIQFYVYTLLAVSGRV